MALMNSLPRREFLKLVAAGVSVALLAACGQSIPAGDTSRSGAAAASAPAKTAPLSPPVTIKVSDAQTAAHAALYIAMDRGYFQDEGINIENVGPVSLDAQIPQLGTGQLDVGLNSVVPGLLNAAARGVGVRILSMAIDHQPGRSYPIVARKDLIDAGDLKSYADLKGKTYSTTAIPSTAVQAIDKALQMGGLKLTDIKLQPLSFPDIAVALANKQVDIAFLAEPFATSAIDKGIAVKWKEEAEFVAGHPQSIWLGSEKLVSSQPEAARRFMVALLRGGRDYEDAFGKNKGRKDVVDILIKHTTVKDPALYDHLNWAKIPENGDINLKLLKEDADWLAAQGAVPQMPELSKLVASELTTYAVQRLGPYS